MTDRKTDMACAEDLQAGYKAITTGAGLCLLADRATLDITGNDRATWLHNLVTNEIRNLQVGDGDYAFAVNVQGRIQFDLNVMVRDGFLRLDVDRSHLAGIISHFEKYCIVEDVQIVDRSHDDIQIALMGPAATAVTDQLGATNASAMASLGSAMVPLAGAPRLMVRHDMAGVFGVVFHVEASAAEVVQDELLQLGRSIDLQVVKPDAIRIARIEAGIPVFDEDIDADVLPAETGQLERSVSFVKGCYLGQEVIERMRTRGGLARRLVGLTIDASAEDISRNTAIQVDDQTIGRVTSICHSFALDQTIALGYVKTPFAISDTQVSIVVSHPVTGTVHPLPFRHTS